MGESNTNSYGSTTSGETGSENSCATFSHGGERDSTGGVIAATVTRLSATISRRECNSWMLKKQTQLPK